MLVVLPAEVDEGGLEVQAVADHGVEVPGVVGEDPLQQTLGGRHFSFAGPLHFHVQGNGQVLPDQMADDAAMIVFGDLLVIHFQGAGEALVAAAFAAGEKTRGRPRPRTPSPLVSLSILLRLMRRWTSWSTSRNTPLSNCA